MVRHVVVCIRLMMPSPLVCDLRTGEVVRWDQVLPKSSAEAVKILSQGDSPLIAMRLDRLRAIYVACHKKHDDAP